MTRPKSRAEHYLAQAETQLALALAAHTDHETLAVTDLRRALATTRFARQVLAGCVKRGVVEVAK